MQKYKNNLQDAMGRALANAKITVLNLDGSKADLFKDNGVTPIDNPVTTNRQGEFEFYAANGRYSLSVAAPGFVSEDELDTVLLFDPADYVFASTRVEFVSYVLGAIVPSQALLKAVTTRAVTLPEDLDGSYAYCDTAPTVSVSCPIRHVSGGTATTIGAVNFAAGYITGSFVFPDEVTTEPGDIIEVLAPPSSDATFSGPTLGIVAAAITERDE